MANIPVEKKGGAPWILWLVALIALAGIIWLLVELIDTDADVDEVAVTEPGVEEPMTRQPSEGLNSEVVTSLDQLFGADAENLVNTPVQLSGIEAEAVTGDSTFWITAEGDRRAFAVLQRLEEWEDGPGSGVDGVFNVDQGDDMTLYGEVVRVDPQDPDAWQITGADREELTRNKVYIQVNRVEFQNGDYAYVPGAGDDETLAREGLMEAPTSENATGAFGGEGDVTGQEGDLTEEEGAIAREESAY